MPRKRQPCSDCGALVEPGSTSSMPIRCRPCRQAAARRCVDCGCPVASDTMRCIDCHRTHVAATSKPKRKGRWVVINGVEVRDPRESAAWRRLKDRVVREEPTCRLQFEGICTMVSTTADHIRPVSTHPELALVRSNCRGACKPCNDARGTVPDEALILPADRRSSALSIFDR